MIFDLDGTLTKSKSDLDKEMASLISRLLRSRYVAVTSGCSFGQFESQFLSRLPKDANLSNLFLFPTCSASGYYYDKKRRRFYRSYSNLMSKRDVSKNSPGIRNGFRQDPLRAPEKDVWASL